MAQKKVSGLVAEEQQSKGGNESLREELDAAVLLRLPSQYRERIEQLRCEFGHAIQILELKFPCGIQPTCFAYAFGLDQIPEYKKRLAESSEEDLPPLNSALLKKIIESGKLLELQFPQNGAVAIYLEDDIPKHAGIFISEHMIRSKWGPAEVHEHRVWEVPRSYGDKVVFYAAPSPDSMLPHLKI